jgi:hypothetical protein
MRCAAKVIPKKKPQHAVAFHIDKSSGRNPGNSQRQKANAQPR